MKLNHYIKIIIGIVLLQFVISCQKEELEIIEDKTNTNLTKDATLVGLLQRVSQQTTSDDNVLDSTSCFAVELPVTVLVNNQQITVNSSADYQLVQNAIDAFSTDDDIVYFNFPITITFQNFSTLVVTNNNQLDDIIEDCGDDDGFDEIDCISIVFPNTFYIYDANNQLAETIVISSNVQLYNFLENLDSNEFIAIQYPISVLDSNGNTVVITSNDALEDFIEAAIDDCDDDSVTPTNLSSIITQGTWYISYFDNEGTIETPLYSGYTFTFNTDGTTTAQSSTVIAGTWSNYMDSGVEKLDLLYTGVTLDEIGEDWEVLSYTATSIQLVDISGGSTDIKYLNFTKN